MTTTVSKRSSATLNPTRQQLDELDALLQRMLELPVAKIEDNEPSEPESAVEEMPPAVASHDVRSAPAPVSYMVVETASPRPLPLASGFAPQPPALTPRLVPVSPMPEEEIQEPETPVQFTLPPADVEPASRGADATPLAARGADAAPLATDAAAPLAEDEVWVPLRSTWQPSPQTWPPLADSWHHANGSSPATETPAPQLEISPLPENIDTAHTPLTPTPLPPEGERGLMTPLAPEGGEGSGVRGEIIVTEPRLSLSAEDAPEAGPTLLLPLVWFNQGFDACLAPLGSLGRWMCGPSGRQILGFVGLASLAAATAIAILAGLGCTW